jgi:hypothetical protein
VPHDGGAENPGSAGQFSRIGSDNIDAPTPAHRTTRSQGRHAVLHLSSNAAARILARSGNRICRATHIALAGVNNSSQKKTQSSARRVCLHGKVADLTHWPGSTAQAPQSPTLLLASDCEVWSTRMPWICEALSIFMRCMSLLMARSCRSGMSAGRSQSGGKRTWPERPNSVENDPSLPCGPDLL